VKEQNRQSYIQTSLALLRTLVERVGREGGVETSEGLTAMT
jgi:hypothetical protein